MKAYRNEDLGFEISIPDRWPMPSAIAPDTILINCAPVESFNVIVGYLAPERLLEYTAAEFRHYAQSQGYTDVEMGRIIVGNKEHVWARYNMGNENWTKKYMIVFGGIEYAMTATCYKRDLLNEKEKIWDLVVRSFQLSHWREQDAIDLNSYRSQVAGELYQQAYQASAQGRYQDACSILEKCLKEKPNHILAHKELAFIQKNTGDLTGALAHRQIVKRLDPTDQVNRYNLAMLLYMLGSKEDALNEIDALLAIEPNKRRYVETKRYFETN
jgi:tetratricopeptide (TPR) repeat protein